MRHDRPAKHPCVTVETPMGMVYEMDVWLSSPEVAAVSYGVLMPSQRRIYEPWLRVSVGADVEAAAGIEIVENDDGA